MRCFHPNTVHRQSGDHSHRPVRPSIDLSIHLGLLRWVRPRSLDQSAFPIGQQLAPLSDDVRATAAGRRMNSRRHSSEPQILLRLPPQGISSTLIDDPGAYDAEPEWPFGRLETLDRDELRQTAYEIFFTACRSTLGSGRLNYNPSDSAEGGTASVKGGTGLTVVHSRTKRALGLRTRRAAPMRPMSHMGSPVMSMSGGGGSGLSSPSSCSSASSSPGKAKQRPMTSAEIMRQQMGVTEQSDMRLRKTLMRLSQVGKKAESIILPLELLRQLKPLDFVNMDEYHHWQRRQLKVLEAGLLLHPSVPLDRLNTVGLRLNEVMHASELRPIDTSKNSEIMRTLCNAVTALAWRNQNGTPTEVCHLTDGYPLNIHLYLALLRAIFDLRDETVVLEEVDELLELVKKTWTTLAINRMVHNVCFTWVLFEQYITTGQVEPDLLTATLGMLAEVAADAKRPEREPGYIRVLSATMSSMQGWAEKRLLDYHEWFDKFAVGTMENVLFLALSVSKILSEEVSSSGSGSMGMLVERENMASSGNFSYQIRVDHYIRSSLKNAFTKVFENGNGNGDSMVVEVDEDPNETLTNMAKETEELAAREKELYSPILKKWHPAPTAIAVVTLHSRYGSVLKQYLSRVSGVTNGLVKVLHTAAKLEKELIRIAAEELTESEDGGKSTIKEMNPYDVDSVIMNLMKKWINDSLKMGRECLNRAKETETWNPKSKSEPYAESAVDLMKLAKVTVDEIFEIQVAGKEELVIDLADGLDAIFQEYISFVASCGSKRRYIPTLPPLTRCNQDSMVFSLWKKAATPCKAGMDPSIVPIVQRCSSSGAGASRDASSHSRTTTSRGTQRLYVRLNTLHYLLTTLHSIDKSLAFFSRQSPSPGRQQPQQPLQRPTPGGGGGSSRRGSRSIAPTHFDLTRSSIHSAILHVAEVAAYRLVFHDSSQYLYESLYVGSVTVGRIYPALRALKHNLAYLVSMLTDRAQPLAVREVMKASFEAFVLVLLAGGSRRAFCRSDYEMITEDFTNLKRIFCASGEGLVAEEVVEREASTVEGVVTLMDLTTEKLVEEFSITACEASGLGRSMERVPMPPTTGRWHRTDPNTMLRVLCHRNDDTANRFLKRTFDLPRRK